MMKFDLNKIIGTFNSLSDQLRYGILAGVVCLVFLLDGLFLVMPQAGSISSMNDQINKLSDDSQQVGTDKQRIGQLRRNLQGSRDQLKALSDRVRPREEVPLVLSTISSTAKENGVKINQLTPEYNLLESLTTAPDGKYYGLPVALKASCGYHMFGRFLNKLENEKMFFIVKDFVIQHDDKNPNIQQFFMTMDLILVDHNATPSKSL